MKTKNLFKTTYIFPSKSSENSIFPAISDVNDISLQIWKQLPPKIRDDSSFVAFQTVFQHKPDDNDLESNHNCANNNHNRQNANKIFAEKESIEEIKPLSSEHDQIPDRLPTNRSTNKKLKIVKVISLLIIWLIFTLILVIKKEKVLTERNLSIPPGSTRSYLVHQELTNDQVQLSLRGSFRPEEFEHSILKNYLSVQMELVQVFNNSFTPPKLIKVINTHWKLPIVSWDQYDSAPNYEKKQIFDLDNDSERTYSYLPLSNLQIRLQFYTNSLKEFPIVITVDPEPVNSQIGIFLAVIIVIVLYVLIIWEIVHRALAAVLMSCLSVAVLAILDNRPTMKEIIHWIDAETLLLLFSMMILVAILTETGIFDYVAVYVFKVSRGKIWPLIHGLGLITLLISAFLDNVTTVLLMTPITIRLCEVMELNPVPILMSIIVQANIGGTATPIGDPPNVIITSNPYIAEHGVTFLSFTLHMSIGVILVAIQTIIFMRIKYRNINDLRVNIEDNLKKLEQDIELWQNTINSQLTKTKDGEIILDVLITKLNILKDQLQKQSNGGVVDRLNYESTLRQLQKQYPIKKRSLLIKSGGCLLLIICLFFVQSFPEIQRLSVSWCALLGTVLLIIIAERDDLEKLLTRVEWTTLLFFAAMFIIMECLDKLGLIAWIGQITNDLILYVNVNYRLAVAIVLILWISAITSAFVDSIPVTTMMIRIVVALAQNSALNLPLTPLVWALAFGPCLGGNGSLIGASANVVCAGIAEKKGYPISFIEFLKFGFPLMLGSVVVITGYLMVGHVLFAWH